MKKEYKTPSCDVILMSAENRLLSDSISESTKNATTVDNGGELSSLGSNFSFDDDD